jgi:hypothetical protein
MNNSENNLFTPLDITSCSHFNILTIIESKINFKNGQPYSGMHILWTVDRRLWTSPLETLLPNSHYRAVNRPPPTVNYRLNLHSLLLHLLKLTITSDDRHRKAAHQYKRSDPQHIDHGFLECF